MPELIDTPVTLASFPEVIPAERRLFLVAVGDAGLEGLVRIEDALQLMELGDLPDISTLLAAATDGKADEATPFDDLAVVSSVLDLGAAATTSVNVTSTSGTIASLGTSAAEGTEYLLKMNGAVTFTHSANLVCPEALDIVAYSGMMVWVKKDAGNVWRVLWYTNRVRVTGGGASRVIFNGAALSGNTIITLPNGPVTIPAGTLEKAWTELTPVATTSGSAVDWNSIPDTATEIELWFDLVSVTGTQSFLVQIGNAGVPITTGYSANSLYGGTSRILSSIGFPIFNDLASYQYNGVMSICRVGPAWYATHSHGSAVTASIQSMGSGRLGLNSSINFIRLTRESGTQTFDNGSVTLRYR